jgi:integrase
MTLARLSISAALLASLGGLLGALGLKISIFAIGARPGKPLSNRALAMTMRRLGAGEYTVHGFRSTFRDWAGDHGVDFEIAEASLAHTVGNKVTRGYLRSTMVARRRTAMDAWAAFLAGEGASVTLVPFTG